MSNVSPKKCWNRWYMAVLLFLLLQIILFLFITRYFS